jgi:hypothetical protein
LRRLRVEEGLPSFDEIFLNLLKNGKDVAQSREPTIPEKKPVVQGIIYGQLLPIASPMFKQAI